MSLSKTSRLTAARITGMLRRLPTGSTLIIHKSGKVQAAVPNPRRRSKNVAAGFYDDEGIFHPIRASYDYKGSRAGESKRKGKKRKAKRKR
jgi:hypothetical protein